MTIRGLLFDKDGTLFDFTRTWAVWCDRLIKALARGEPGAAAGLALALKFDPRAMVFAPDSPVIGNTWAELAEVVIAALPRLKRDRVLALMHETAEGLAQVQAVPLRPLLTLLRGRGLRIGLSTNDAESAARVHLQASDILDLFDFVAGYDSGHGAKPGPGMQHAFCASTGLQPGEVAMIGDSAHDLAAGQAAGMARVGVLTGPATRADLAPLADVVLQDIGALPGWLDQR